MTYFLLFVLIFSGCARLTPPPPEPVIQVSGFNSRESEGEDPVFDLTAARAILQSAPGDSNPKMISASVMNIENVRFTVFSAGKKTGVVAADTGIYTPSLKTVELTGSVTYNALDDSFHVRAERMAWDPAMSVLSCETSVTGTFRHFDFTAERLDISRSRNVFILHSATFSGPG